MNLRTQTSLFCGALALAIAVSVLLRGRPKRAHWLFAAFSVDVGLWYLAQGLYLSGSAAVWARFTAVLALLMPQFALHLFEAIFPQPGRAVLLRVAHVLLALMLVLVLSPQHEHGWVRAAVLLYVFGLFAAGLWSLLRRGQHSRSRDSQRRVRFLVVCGALAASLSLADFLWFVGAPLPPVGAVLSIVFLFVLAESLIRARLVDLYEMAGVALVSTALAFTLGGIFYVFVLLLGGIQTMYLNAVLGGIVVLVLFDPLRDKIGVYIHRAVLLERFDLERAVATAQQQLTAVLDTGEMQEIAMTALEESRRVTSAALYLRDSIGADFERGQCFGVDPPRRLDAATLGPLLDWLVDHRSVDLQVLETQLGEERVDGAAPVRLSGLERVLAAAGALGELNRAVCIAVLGAQREFLGLLIVHDDRVTDAFSSDDVALLESLSVYLAIVLENSRQHLRLQDRAKLAALGHLAAGLAHEIKNPLGAIKGAAQLLSEPHHGAAGSAEFLGIILEEVERLDRVVGSVLDYARPAKGHLGTVDVNHVVERSALILRSSQEVQTVFETRLCDSELWVRADAEQIKQVLLNLARNASQAMDGVGTVTISTRHRQSGSSGYAEISVRDHGPGIPESTIRQMFQPFFTTKATGTGLGLAITERIVQSMAGRVEVASTPGEGAVVSVVLPGSVPPTDSRGQAAGNGVLGVGGSGESPGPLPEHSEPRGEGLPASLSNVENGRP